MSSLRSIGLTAVILLIVFILIAVAATSIIIGGEERISEESIEETLNDVLEEVSTYLQIKDKIGRYNKTNEIQKIGKIAILIKPLISCDIDVSQLTIKLNNGNTVKLLNYGEKSEFIGSNSLFGHAIWNYITENNFGFIVTHDKDKSLANHNLINDNTDMAYIIIKLPKEFQMKKGNIMTVTLFPSTGMHKTITLEAPLPINQIVNL